MEIKFIDQTLRDGQQSLWGMKLRAFQATPALPHLNATGFEVVDLTGGGPFIVLVREFHDDPWATLDHIVAGLRDTSPRAGVRTLAVGGFGFTPDSMIDLWVQTLGRHGIETMWLFDCLFDMPVMERRAKAMFAAGMEVVPAIMYGLTDLHTDQFFADRGREMASWEGVRSIYFEDASGVLTPERAATLFPALQEATPGVRIEMHVHNTTGLAPLVYVEGFKHGIDTVHTCSLPMANGPSLPSTEAMVEIAESLGHTHRLDLSQLPPVAAHFEREALVEGYPLGAPNEYRTLPYRHQLPGGMTGTLLSQLAEHDMVDRFDEVIEEIVLVREDLGQPVMATPFSQFVGIQAVLNVVLGERYKAVPDEVIHYASGHYGPPLRPVDPDIADRIFSQPRAAELAAWERPQPTLAEVRQQFGTHLSDEELLLRFLIPAAHVDAMLTAGPIRTRPRTRSSELIEDLAELVTGPGMANRISVAQPRMSVTVARNGARDEAGAAR
jgi:oxaloacetate decarboxylase alpha subunit